MAFQGIKGGGLRSPRTRALEMGAAKKGFSDAMPYDAQGGHPIAAGMPDGEYEAHKPNVGVPGGPKPIDAKTKPTG